MTLTCSVYIRGYQDANYSSAGFAELVDYAGDAPPDWIRKAFRELHTKLADRPSSNANGDRPLGAIFMTLHPPADVDSGPYFAIILLSPVSGASGRIGYQFYALFAERRLFALDSLNFPAFLAECWLRIEWERIANRRPPIYQLLTPRQYSLSPFFRPKLGLPEEDWVAQVRPASWLDTRSPDRLQVAECLNDRRISSRLPQGCNIVFGLDFPLQVLGTTGWRWIRVGDLLNQPVPGAGMLPESGARADDRSAPANDRMPPQIAALVENRKPAEIAQMRRWLFESVRGIGHETTRRTLVGGGWPEPYIRWILENEVR